MRLGSSVFSVSLLGSTAPSGNAIGDSENKSCFWNASQKINWLWMLNWEWYWSTITYPVPLHTLTLHIHFPTTLPLRETRYSCLSLPIPCCEITYIASHLSDTPTMQLRKPWKPKPRQCNTIGLVQPLRLELLLFSPDGMCSLPIGNIRLPIRFRCPVSVDWFF